MSISMPWRPPRLFEQDACLQSSCFIFPLRYSLINERLAVPPPSPPPAKSWHLSAITACCLSKNGLLAQRNPADSRQFSTACIRLFVDWGPVFIVDRFSGLLSSPSLFVLSPHQKSLFTIPEVSSYSFSCRHCFKVSRHVVKFRSLIQLDVSSFLS